MTTLKKLEELAKEFEADDSLTYVQRMAEEIAQLRSDRETIDQILKVDRETEQLRTELTQCKQLKEADNVALKSANKEIAKLREEVVVADLNDKIGMQIHLSKKLRASEAREMVLREALKFYSQGSSWTSSDDEFCFIKVIGADWHKPNGHYSGGYKAKEALTIPEPDTALLVKRLVEALEIIAKPHINRVDFIIAGAALADTQEIRRSLGL